MFNNLLGVLSLKAKKGQINSIDLVVAMLIFVVIILFLIQIWGVELKSADTGAEFNALQSKALSLSDMLVKSGGVPARWERANQTPDSFGLVQEPNVLDVNKLNKFFNMNYSDIKYVMGMDNEYYISIIDLDGNILYSIRNDTGDINGAGSSNGGAADGQSASVTRFAILNNEIVKLRLVVYD